MVHTRKTGGQHEQLAALFLQKKGLKLVATNHHSRYGEIDLIMQDGDTLVFIEVRYRSSNSFGGAVASVTPSKQRKIAITALHYLQSQKQNNAPCRFDVIAVTGNECTWLKGAFDSPL